MFLTALQVALRSISGIADCSGTVPEHLRDQVAPGNRSLAESAGNAPVEFCHDGIPVRLEVILGESGRQQPHPAADVETDPTG